MTNPKEFLVNLVSNASMGLYPQNKISSFTTQLPGKGLHLPNGYTTGSEERGTGSGFWEVALLEICFPEKVKNIVYGEYGMTSKRLKNEWRYTQLKHGLYRNVSEILDEMHDNFKLLNELEFGVAVKDQPNVFSYRHSATTGAVEIKMLEEGAQLRLKAADLRAVLGYDEAVGLDGIAHFEDAGAGEKGWVKSQYPADIQRLHTMMVYTDIIEHQIIGDTTAPLLRVIPLVSKMKHFDMSGVENSQAIKIFTEPLQFKKTTSKHVSFNTHRFVWSRRYTDTISGCWAHSPNTNVSL